MWANRKHHPLGHHDYLQCVCKQLGFLVIGSKKSVTSSPRPHRHLIFTRQGILAIVSSNQPITAIHTVLYLQHSLLDIQGSYWVIKCLMKPQWEWNHFLKNSVSLSQQQYTQWNCTLKLMVFTHPHTIPFRSHLHKYNEHTEVPLTQLHINTHLYATM